MSQDEQKREAAVTALNHILPDLTPRSIIGVGTGSTVDHLIDALAREQDAFDGAVASSEATANKLKAHGIPVYDLNAVEPPRFYIDGADEANHRLELIKGGGGALTREKILAAASETFIGIIDESKQVDMLGEFPLPVEVIPMARSYVGRELVRLGGDPEYRAGVTTDNGNIILDVHYLDISRPIKVEEAINQITGVVTNGLFAKRPADKLFVASDSGLRTLKR